MDWSQIDWVAVGTAALGMLICTGGGLIAVAANQDKPATFAPLYIISLIIFVSGLTMIIYCPTIWTDLQTLPGQVHEEFGEIGVVGVIGALLAIVGGIVIMGGGLWFIGVAFEEGVGWGLGCLFIPFVSFIFLVAHWHKAWKPFVLQLVGIVPIGIGIVMVVIDAGMTAVSS